MMPTIETINLVKLEFLDAISELKKKDPDPIHQKDYELAAEQIRSAANRLLSAVCEAMPPFREALAMNEEQPMGEKKGAMKRGGEGQALRDALEQLIIDMRWAAKVVPVNRENFPKICNDFANRAERALAAAPAMKRDQLDTQRQAESDGDRIREFKSWLAGGMRGYADICFRVDKLVYDERADSAAAGPPATLTLEQILNVLYKGRTMVNFNHVPSVTRAIDWLSMDFRRVMEELPATAATPTEPPKPDEDDWITQKAAEEDGAMVNAGTAPNGKRDLDGLRELPGKWREAIVKLKAGVEDSPSYDLKRMIKERAEAFTVCAEELEAALAAQRDPLDKPQHCKESNG